MTKLQICNLASQHVGAGAVTQAQLDGDLTEVARILNDVYDSTLDEIIGEHPWNFAIARAKLTEIGGTITTWADNGSNVWYATLAYDPAKVFFDNNEGDEAASAALCIAEYNWYWDSATSRLYVYSTSDPDTAYTEVNAIIAEFDWDYSFALPSNCLRVIKMEDNAEFVKEGSYLFTDESEARIQYIKQETDTTKFSPAFIEAFSLLLGSKLAFPVTNVPTLQGEMYKLYQLKLRKAKGIDAQEGTAQKEESIGWQIARK